MLSLVDNALVQGLSYGLAVVGVSLAFRGFRFPDLTADGSFTLGAVVFGGLLSAGAPWVAAAAAAIAAGGIAGGITAGIYRVVKINKLLAGILTSMICYSLAFRVLTGQPSMSLSGYWSPYQAAAAVDRNLFVASVGINLASLSLGAAFFLLVAALIWFVLRSEWGLVLRGAGAAPGLIRRLGHKPDRYLTVGLVLANGIVGLSGALVASRQRFVDVNMGIGVILTLIAALLVGEAVWARLPKVVRRWRLIGPLAAAGVGTFAYYLLYLIVLRISVAGGGPFTIEPTDLKMLSALVIVGVVLARRTRVQTLDDALTF